MEADRQINVRVPADDLDWLRAEMKKNRRSLTSEVVLAIQEKRERSQRDQA